MKACAEQNSLLGFICVHQDIYEAILHSTANSNFINDYSKLVKKEEKRIRSEDSSSSSNEMVKIDVNFTQYHVKMLADVMEAIIGAIFLDTICANIAGKEFKEETEKEKPLYDEEVKEPIEETKRNEDSEEIKEDEGASGITHESYPIFKIESIWTNLFEDYLRLYTDNPELPAKARYYKDISKDYCRFIRENTDVVSVQLTKDEVESITGQTGLNKIIREEVDSRPIGEPLIKDKPVVKFVYFFRMQYKKWENRSYFQVVYDVGYKKKEFDFFEKLYAHMKQAMNEFENKAKKNNIKLGAEDSANFFTFVRDHFADLNHMELPRI